MSLDLTDTQNQHVSFGTVAAVQGLASRTFLGWVNFDALAGVHAQSICYVNYGTGTNEYWSIFVSVTSKLFVTTIGWSTTSGAWGSNSALTTGRHHLAITYSNSATTNDPILYVDGASVAITEAATPAGTYRAGTTTTTFLGTANAGDYPIDGKLESMCVYNRIFTADEIAEAYASKLAIPTRRGLVFAPQLHGAAGNVGEGGTLAAGNTIADAVTGALGVPSGSPLFRQDTYLTY